MQIGSQNAQNINNIEWNVEKIEGSSFGDMNVKNIIDQSKKEANQSIDNILNELNKIDWLDKQEKEKILKEGEQLKKVVNNIEEKKDETDDNENKEDEEKSWFMKKKAELLEGVEDFVKDVGNISKKVEESKVGKLMDNMKNFAASVGSIFTFL